MKIALAMIVKGSDSEAKYLERALSNAAPHVDGIFITITHYPGEQVNKKVFAIAKKYRASISVFEWQYDFSAARNFNFLQVPKSYDYILWMDADDVWRNLGKLRAIVKKHSSIDAFGFWYLYDWDEFKMPTVVHKKTMLVKNDKSVEWVGAIHEEFEASRALETYLIEGIDRLHLSEDKHRHEMNALRNLDIAEREAKKKPDDPRSFWNLGNAQYGVNDIDGSIKTFTRFLDESESDEEKYIAHTRLSDVLKSVNRNDEAIKQLHIAIGLRPMIPDAYFHLAYLYKGLANLDKAEEYVLQGMRLRPQIHKMIVYNPRDYDYNPMMLAAQIYAEKNRPDFMLTFLEGCLGVYPKDERLKRMVKDGRLEKKKLEKVLYKVQALQKIRSKTKLKEALDKLPNEYKSHPAVAVLRNNNFKKNETSGKDLVIYAGQTTHEWYPGKGFIGGSEEAVINLAREMQRAGYNVTVYNNCGHTEKEFDGVKYIPFWMFNYRDKQDVVILWRWCKPLDAEINAPRVFVDLHDVIPPGELNEKRLIKVTKVMVKSEFHRSLFPNVPDNKIAVVPNGIDLSLLGEPPYKKDPMLVINTSSPDRSMDVLPGLWIEVKKKVPNAKMQWAYGWQIFEKTFANDTKKLGWMKEIQRNMKTAGIEDLGRLNQEEIAKLYQKASILAYPTEFAEIDCISVRKAQAANCSPVTTDFGALAESVHFGDMTHSTKTKDTWCKPYQFHFGLEGEQAQRDWVEAMVYRLKHPQPFNGVEWRKQFSWENIAKRWIALIER